MAYEKAQVHTEPCPTCKAPIAFALGKPSSIGRETKDEDRGISNDLDLKDKLRERSNEHFRTHELSRLIEKEGKDFAIRNGWINEDGTVKK